MNAQETIKDALYMLQEESDIVVADDSAYDRGLRFLNSFLKIWYGQGLKIFTGNGVQTLQSELPVIDDAYMAVVSNFAIYVAPFWGATPSNEAVMTAATTEAEMRALYGADVNSVFPSTLPIGSGNEWPEWGSWSDKFYPSCDPDIYPNDTPSDSCTTDDNFYKG